MVLRLFSSATIAKVLVKHYYVICSSNSLCVRYEDLEDLHQNIRLRLIIIQDKAKKCISKHERFQILKLWFGTQ